MSHRTSGKLPVYLEVGTRRTIAAALDWPGWCRNGQDEAGALQALFEYGPRYAQVLRRTRLGFVAPGDISGFIVVERLKGNATTDYGVPGLAPSVDSQPLDKAELRRLQAILKACWRTFDRVVESARGKALHTGPRGGGRTLDGIVEHVFGAETGYISSLGGKELLPETTTIFPGLLHQAILKAMKASAQGEYPTHGPRGGKRWTTRYFTRRDAWHILDHAWEIEDRILEQKSESFRLK
jgi:hypothetical protein